LVAAYPEIAPRVIARAPVRKAPTQRALFKN